MGCELTLVVAQHSGPVVSAVCDTGVIENQKQLPFARQCPKLCILENGVAVGFAGVVALATQYIREFNQSGAINFSEIADYFLDCHLDSQRRVDFILLFDKPLPRLVVVRDGERKTGATGWIGDKAAFEAFQKYRSQRHGGPHVSSHEDFNIVTHSNNEANPNNKAFNLLGAMRFVMLDPAVRSAFGFAATVNNLDGEFRFRNYTFVLGDKVPSIILPEQLVQKISPDLEELREFAQSCFVSVPGSAKRALAYHFPRGKLTYMFWAEDGPILDCTRCVLGKNLDEFNAMTRTEMGIEWQGSLVLRTEPPASYGIDRKRWKTSVTPFRKR